MNINLGTHIKLENQGNSGHSNDSDNVNPDAAIALLGVAAAIAASYALISDSTPGNYLYAFYNKSGDKLPITLEWHDDGDYSLIDQYGEEITVL